MDHDFFLLLLQTINGRVEASFLKSILHTRMLKINETKGVCGTGD